MAIVSKTIFPNDLGLSNITADFAIEDSIAILKFRGLKKGDKLYIESRFGAECDKSWIPVVFCCKPMVTSDCSTHMIIPIPGHYRAVLVNEEGLHETDPTYFDDVMISVENHKLSHDLSAYFQLCC